MAERRMFAKTIVMSDDFLDMPATARCLYFTLGMLADDDGFVNTPRSIMRQIGASVDDMNILLARKFVLGFDSGVIVIKHWRINNYLRSDRYQETKYLEEKEELTIEKNGAYTMQNYVPTPLGIPCGIPVVYPDKDRIGKDRIDKDRDILSSEALDRGAQEPVSRIHIYNEIIEYLNSVAGTRYQANSKTTRKHINARLSDGYTVDDFKEVINKKCRQWMRDPKMAKFIRPETLFGTKFEAYLNEVEPVSETDRFMAGLERIYNEEEPVF